MEPFSYDLPADRIAQRPWEPPDEAKLLVVDRRTGTIATTQFTELPDLLEPGDLLVLNDTRVIPARLFGTTGERSVEVLLLREIHDGQWTVMGRPMKLLRRGVDISFGDNLLGRIEPEGEQNLRCTFSTRDDSSVKDALWRVGTMPIPPYIRGGIGDQRDITDYQTIFARKEGSVAAPTASLHFTDRLFERCKARGIARTFLTLHVGSASFLPVYRAGSDGFQEPGTEWFEVPEATRKLVRNAHANGRRVIAIGTTVARALESIGRHPESSRGETDVFITPGFEWRVATNLVTNFHQPGTSHLLLVESLLGKQLLSRAYQTALQEGFRFLSYGDGMIIV